jgi:hypothetical protein
MREVKTFQDFVSWVRVAKAGEKVIYSGDSRVLNRDIAIERAILDNKNVRVKNQGRATILIAKGVRGRGSERPHQSRYSHVASAASIGAPGASWERPGDPRPGKKKIRKMRKAILEAVEGPARGHDHVLQHVIDTHY